MNIETAELINPPLDAHGLPVHYGELEDTEEGILAVLPDDRVVMLVGYTRVRVGGGICSCEGSKVGLTWDFVVQRDPIPGLYAAMSGYREAVAREVARRKKRSPKWACSLLVGYQALDDEEIATEATTDGWERILRSVP
jgi:hypothetical protein